MKRMSSNATWLIAVGGLFATLISGCAGSSTRDKGLERLKLFDDQGTARFDFYFQCRGQVAAETEMCWIPSKYFSEWAGTRHFAIREIGDAEFDPLGRVADHGRTANEKVTYRVLVRFEPIALPSYTSETDGLGGYTSPKAGYQADLFVYAATTGQLEYQTTLRKKSDAPHKANAVPYVKAGVDAVIFDLDGDFAK